MPSNDQRSAATASIRLPIDFFSRDKIRVIRGQKDGNQTVLLYILLVCMAAKANRHGELALSDEIPYDDNIIASLAQMEQKQVQTALADLMKYGLIRLSDDVYTVVNFDSMTDAGRKRRAGNGKKAERG